MKPAGKITLNYTNVLEPFLAKFKLAMFAGFILASPIILYQVMAFLAPALKKKERSYLYFGIFGSTILFVFGVVFGYWKILPVGVKWLLDQGEGAVTPVLKITEFITVIGWFLIAFGLAFETPMILVLLVKIGIISREALKANWRIVYVIILVASAMLTPDFSPITMLMLSIPMIGLYHATILALRWL